MGLFVLWSRVFWLFKYSKTQTNITWSKNLGGSGDEAPELTLTNLFGAPGACMDVQTSGVLVAAFTFSSDVMVGGNSGNEDVWIMKLTHSGDTLWSSRLGGSDFERPSAVLSLPDGICVLVGRTLSSDGPFSGNHGAYDSFAFRFNSAGGVVWKKLYGSSSSDYLFDVILASDGTLVMCGESISVDGDLAGSGAGLAWLLKVEMATGAVVLSKSYVGPNGALPDALENFYRIIELSDGSCYLAAGYTVANFNNINGDDFYYHKVSPTGQSMWSKKIRIRQRRRWFGRNIGWGQWDFLHHRSPGGGVWAGCERTL